MVKCADCGFLASRNRTTRELDETEESFRAEAISPLVWDERGNNPHMGWEPTPVCYARASDLAQEVKESTPADKQAHVGVHVVISHDRECKSWLKWQQGFTPKEHREMMDREEWRKWREEREGADREWRAAQDLANKGWQAHENRKMVLYSGGFTIVGAGIAAIVSWFAYGGSN